MLSSFSDNAGGTKILAIRIESVPIFVFDRHLTLFSKSCSSRSNVRAAINLGCLFACFRSSSLLAPSLLFCFDRFGIKYPQMYAEQSDPNAIIFNCYQRAHQVSFLS